MLRLIVIKLLNKERCVIGLDQFAYSINKDGEKHEIAYWRKHPNLQGWMENLWRNKGCPNSNEHSDPHGLSDFNCVPLELNEDDLDLLEKDIKNSKLPSTGGFFFGDNSDDYYYQKDLEFIEKARDAIDSGLTVVYDSWW